MISELKTLAENSGNRLEMISVDRIKSMRAELNRIQYEPEMADYQSHIMNNLYKFDRMPESTKSVIIMAVSKPAYANVVLNNNGKEYRAFSPVSVNFNEAMSNVMEVVKKEGYEIMPEFSLPLKRLAVQSGLAEYGKNNIAYVNGLGGNIVFVAFYTNIPYEKDNWRETIVAEKCKDCDFCMNNCPTGAIRKDLFHINSLRCISQFHVSGEEYPDWLPDSAHHTVYYCLKCQVGCPMNAEREKVIDVAFDEGETGILLNEKAFDDDMPAALKEKIELLGFGKWHTVPRNLKALFEAMDKGHKPKIINSE